MAIHLSHMTAADFWRCVYSSDRSPSAPLPFVPFEDSSRSIDDLRKTAPDWLDASLTELEQGRIHLLVPSAAGRFRSSGVVSHVWSTPLPEGSFYEYSSDLFISSPAFTFLQMAKHCTLPQLVAYGCELCGRYSYDPNAARGFRPRAHPLSTIAKLSAYLDGTAGMPGHTRARRALDLVSEHSESPMETTVMELLSLPCRYGGYGIPNLTMNTNIPLTESAQAIAARRKCRADLSSEKAHIDIEYQGKHDHEGPGALDLDRRRTNAITSMGYKVKIPPCSVEV